MRSSYEASSSLMGEVERALEWNFSKRVGGAFLAERAVRGRSASVKRKTILIVRCLSSSQATLS